MHFDDIEENVVDSQRIREDAATYFTSQGGRNVFEKALEFLLLILSALHGDEILLDLALSQIGQLEVVHCGIGGVNLLLEMHALAVQLAHKHSHNTEDVRVHH